MYMYVIIKQVFGTLIMFRAAKKFYYYWNLGSTCYFFFQIASNTISNERGKYVNLYVHRNPRVRNHYVIDIYICYWQNVQLQRKIHRMDPFEKIYSIILMNSIARGDTI